jgi:hypothetical protein
LLSRRGTFDANARIVVTGIEQVKGGSLSMEVVMAVKCRPERTDKKPASKPVVVKPHTRSNPKPIGKKC